MKILMFGWEFPPCHSGGLGTACYGLTKWLSKQGVDISFVLPKKLNVNSDYVKFVFGNELNYSDKNFVNNYVINSFLEPYMSSQSFYETKESWEERVRNDRNFVEESSENDTYGKDLFSEVERYASIAEEIANQESFDLVHAHDWMTFKAGISIKNKTKKPLIVHIHATEFDRTGGNGNNEYVYQIEKEGMESADIVIANSEFTKRTIIEKYGINPLKVKVVHNSVEFENYDLKKVHALSEKNKMVLSLGRITLQKGVDYFVEAAKKVLEHYPNVYFVVAGSGDMDKFIIRRAAELGIANRVLFTGFLRGEDVNKAYQMCDLYVMPSVSEPFGISPLESLMNNTPVLISKQSGVSEVLKNCLKVDFWDVDEMANKIISVLKYDELQKCLKENGYEEVKNMSWSTPAKKCIELYGELLKKGVH